MNNNIIPIIDNETEMLLNPDEFLNMILKFFTDGIINLSNLGIVKLRDDIFNNIEITELDLSSNMLEEIPKIPDVEKINLYRNKIRNINCLIFFKNIIDLNLSYNLIKIDKNIFDNLINLTILNLAGNKIDNLDNNVFAKLIKLKELNLSGNFLTNVDNIIISQTLEIYNLSYNRLTKPPSILGIFLNIKKIYLNDNNF